MNILSIFVLFVILLKCAAASEDDVGGRFKEAVDGENFEWLKENWESWKKRNDLLDDVIAKGADVTVRLIQNVRRAKRCVLAALFDKGEGMIDGVLGRIEYDDDDLCDLTGYRHELAGSPEKFFKVLDKIKDPWNQEWAVRWGVIHLFGAGRHDLVVPLVNALGKRTFKRDHLKEWAIQMAFHEGAERGKQDIVEEYYEHPVITSEEYAIGLMGSWNFGNPNKSFSFYWSKLTKETWIWSKRNMRVGTMKSSVKPLAKHPNQPHLLEQDISSDLKGYCQACQGDALQHCNVRKWQGGPSIVALYLVDEEVWNTEMRRLKPAQSPMKDIIKQRQREEEERRSKKILDDMQKKRDAEKRAEDDKRLQTIKSWEKEVEDVNDGVPCTPSNPKGNGDKTPKGQQKKKRPSVNRSKTRDGSGQGRAKSGGKSKKTSTSFPLSKPSQRASMRVPLPTAEPGRRGTLVGDDAAAELLKKFEPADQERYELYANLHGYEAAIERMQRDLEAPPTRPDSGASPSTESASLSSRSRESGDDTSGPGHPVPQACASGRRKVKGVKIHIDELAHIDLDSVAPKSQERPPHDDSSDGLLALAMNQSIEEH